MRKKRIYIIYYGLISLLSILYLLFKIGIFTRYNYFTAQWDSLNHNYTLIVVEEYPDVFATEIYLADKYNYKVLNLKFNGIYLTDINRHGIRAYNKVMYKANLKNMSDAIRKQYKSDQDSIYIELSKGIRM
jgi:hypothetical protein